MGVVMKRKYRKSPSHQSQERILQETKVYVMHNIPMFWINKFGITDNTKNRVRSVSETTTGVAFHIFAPTLAFGWECEQFVHWLYHFQNYELKQGSGRREWFVVFSPIFGSLFLIGSYYFGLWADWRIYVAAYFTPFVWWDGLLWLLIFAAARFLIYGAILLAVIYFFAHIH